MSGLTTSASCEGNLEWWKLILPSFFWSSLPVGTVRDKIVSGLAGCWQELWVTSSQEDVCVQNNGRLFVSAYSQFVLCRARRAVVTGARLDETEDEPLAGKHVWAFGGESRELTFSSQSLSDEPPSWQLSSASFTSAARDDSTVCAMWGLLSTADQLLERVF